MHPALLAIHHTPGLNNATKTLAALAYAYTNGSGSAEIPLAEVETVVGVQEHKLRSYRAALARCGFFMEHRLLGGTLYVEIDLAYSAPCGRGADEKRAATARSDDESAPLRRAADDDRATTARCDDESAPLRRAAEPKRATTARFPPTPPRESEELINLTTEPETPHSPQPPADSGTPADAAPSAAEQAATRALLALPEISASYRGAARIAAAYPFRHVLAHAVAWHREERKPGSEAGLLIWRIANQPAPELPELYLHYPLSAVSGFHAAALTLYRGLRPASASEPEPEPESEPDPDEPEPADAPADAPVAPSADPELCALWDNARNQLRIQLPQSAWETWVRDTQIASREADAFVVRCANAYARDWLSLRLSPLIRRTLAGIVGRPATVTFEVAEVQQ